MGRSRGPRVEKVKPKFLHQHNHTVLSNVTHPTKRPEKQALRWQLWQRASCLHPNFFGRQPASQTYPRDTSLRSIRVNIDAALIEIERACGSGSVRTDEATRVLYSADASEAVCPPPDAVVFAHSPKDVARTFAVAQARGVPVTPRSGGTGKVGGSVAAQGGIVLALEGMHELDVCPQDWAAVCGPGVVLGDLHRAAEAENCLYPPDPGSLATCQVGGTVATNAAGPSAVKYGATAGYVLGLQVVWPDGSIHRLGGRTQKRVSGYDLVSLMVGSEGTLGVITEATLRLMPKPESIATLRCYWGAANSSKGTSSSKGASNKRASIGAWIQRARLHAPDLRCAELFDATTLSIASHHAGLSIPRGAEAMVLFEVDGDEAAVAHQAPRLAEAALEHGALDVVVEEQAAKRARLWDARRSISDALRKQARHKLSEDVVVPLSRLDDLIAACRELSEEYGIVIPAYGHAGDGNLHVNFLWDDEGQRPAVNQAIRALFERTVEMGGAVSGEHGIGLLKAPFLSVEQPEPLIELQRNIKRVFDPRGILNPGKIFGGASCPGC